MSGIKVGTRLEQLEQLRTRIDLEIEAERRAHPELGRPVAPRRPSATPKPRPGLKATNAAKRARLEALGITRGELLAWAVGAGFIPPGPYRGMPRDAVIDAYESHHQRDRSNDA